MGFTLVEIAVVLGISFAIIAVVSFSFSSFKNNSSLEKSVAQAKSVLEEARYDSVSGKSNYAYGVKVETDKLTLFQGPSYSSSSTQNKVYSFDTNTSTIDTISLNGGGSEILFKKITGNTDSYGTFRIKMISDNKSATIRVTGTGIISEE